MKTAITQKAVDTVVHMGYTPENIWWGTEAEPGMEAHLFIKLVHAGPPSEIARILAHGAVVTETGLDEDHVHVT